MMSVDAQPTREIAANKSAHVASVFIEENSATRDFVCAVLTSRAARSKQIPLDVFDTSITQSDGYNLLVHSCLGLREQELARTNR